MKLSEKRVLFTRLLAMLIVRASAVRSLQLAFGEGYVALTDAADGDYDGPHKKAGAHYTGVGMDMILYRNGDPVTDGSDPDWVWLGETWERMDPLCRWGGRFRDANHFSLFHEGKS